MPKTRKDLRATRKRRKSNDSQPSPAKVAKDAVMADNVNSNHSKDTTINSRHSKLTETKRQVKTVEKTSNEQLEKRSNNRRKQSSIQTPQIIQFEEGENVIQMEIDDGGAAAAEFASDYEEEGQIVSESESETDQNTTQNETDFDNSQTGDESAPEEYFTVRSEVVDCQKVIQNENHMNVDRMSSRNWTT